jgi:hypothetical protein
VRAEDQNHVGIVVAGDDYEATLARLSAVFGYRWCDEVDVTIPVALADGERQLNLRFTYSREAPRLEVIRSVPGTPWEPAAGSGVHHLGYWSDDVLADSARLEAQGFPREAAAVRPGGTPTFVYHRGPAGPRIELVDSRARPALEQYWAAGTMPGPG